MTGPDAGEVRRAFLDAAATARSIVALPEVGHRWREPSALKEMTVGALAAHLAAAVANADRLLQAAPPSGKQPVSAARHFSDVGPDLSSPDNARVRTRAAEEAVLGHRAVLGQLDRALERVRSRLPGEPPDRLVSTREEVLLLDDYLRTRLIELATHTDDLCVTLRRETPPLPGVEVAIALLVEIAELRHGHLGVLRALARRERDGPQALRVI
jgi:hypothetical protein